ncbi:MAG: carotenoid biosynthesis protein [Planctomycetes bacterium]|nr:carotenoid biosynthesis protein [Planctomycetota bacterium]
MGALFYSIWHRPYVFVFLLAFLAFSWMEQGKLRTGIWLVTGYLVALTAEWCSVNPAIRIPFGYYVYHDDVLANDLAIFGVPFFDSLSFAFLSYVSFSFAQFFMSPLWRRGFDYQRVTSRGIRNSPVTLLLGAALMMVIDIIVDPVAHLGRHWFLGDIYHYPSPGYHFDVTMANYAGWFVVGWVIIFINQRVDAFLANRELASGRELKLPYVPAKGLFAPLFWAGILLFNLGVTAWLGWAYDPGDLEFDAAEVRKLFLAGCFVVGPILLLAAIQLLKPANRPSYEDVTAWLADYPNPKLKARIRPDSGNPS